MIENPVELTNIMTLPRAGGSIGTPQGGMAEAGMFLEAPEGRRMFYGTACNDCIFVQCDTRPSMAPTLGKFYKQSMHGFQYDIGKYGAYADVGRRLHASQEVIKNFLDVFTGAVALAGGPVGWAIAGMNLAVTAGKIKNEYSAFAKVIDTILYHHDFFTTKLPTFTTVLLGEYLASVLENKAINYGKGLVAKTIPGAGGKVAGVILSQLGEDRMKVRFAALSTVLKEVLIKVAVHCCTHYPEKLSEEQVKQLAQHIKLKIVDTTQFQIRDEVRLQMIREVANNPLSLPARFQAIASAIDVIYG